MSAPGAAGRLVVPSQQQQQALAAFAPPVACRDEDILIVWDHQNVRMPLELPPATLLSFLYDTFVACRSSNPRRCVGCYASFTDSTKLAIGKARFHELTSNGVLNVTMINSAGGRRKAHNSDHPLVEAMLTFTVGCLRAGRRGVILLLSGDADFVRPAVWCRQQGCVALELLYWGPNVSRDMLGLQTSWRMEWRAFLDAMVGVPLAWTFPYPQEELQLQVQPAGPGGHHQQQQRTSRDGDYGYEEDDDDDDEAYYAYAQHYHPQHHHHHYQQQQQQPGSVGPAGYGAPPRPGAIAGRQAAPALEGAHGVSGAAPSAHAGTTAQQRALAGAPPVQPRHAHAHAPQLLLPRPVYLALAHNGSGAPLAGCLTAVRPPHAQQQQLLQGNIPVSLSRSFTKRELAQAQGHVAGPQAAAGYAQQSVPGVVTPPPRAPCPAQEGQQQQQQQQAPRAPRSLPTPQSMQRQGSRKGVMVHGGAFQAAGLQGGTLHDSMLQSGALQGGMFQGGALQGGMFQGGALQSGALQGGALMGGALMGGAAQGGAIQGGASAVEADAAAAAATFPVAATSRQEGSDESDGHGGYGFSAAAQEVNGRATGGPSAAAAGAPAAAAAAQQLQDSATAHQRWSPYQQAAADAVTAALSVSHAVQPTHSAQLCGHEALEAGGGAGQGAGYCAGGGVACTPGPPLAGLHPLGSPYMAHQAPPPPPPPPRARASGRAAPGAACGVGVGPSLQPSRKARASGLASPPAGTAAATAYAAPATATPLPLGPQSAAGQAATGQAPAPVAAQGPVHSASQPVLQMPAGASAAAGAHGAAEGGVQGAHRPLGQRPGALAPGPEGGAAASRAAAAASAFAAAAFGHRPPVTAASLLGGPRRCSSTPCLLTPELMAQLQALQAAAATAAAEQPVPQQQQRQQCTTNCDAGSSSGGTSGPGSSQSPAPTAAPAGPMPTDSAGAVVSEPPAPTVPPTMEPGAPAGYSQQVLQPSPRPTQDGAPMAACMMPVRGAAAAGASCAGQHEGRRYSSPPARRGRRGRLGSPAVASGSADDLPSQAAQQLAANAGTGACMLLPALAVSVPPMAPQHLWSGLHRDLLQQHEQAAGAAGARAVESAGDAAAAYWRERVSDDGAGDVQPMADSAAQQQQGQASPQQRAARTADAQLFGGSLALGSARACADGPCGSSPTSTCAACAGVAMCAAGCVGAQQQQGLEPHPLSPPLAIRQQQGEREQDRDEIVYVPPFARARAGAGCWWVMP